MEPKNNQTKLYYLIGLGALGISLAVFFYVKIFGSNVSTDDAFIEGRIHVVAPKIFGTVKTVNVADNQMVKEGDLIIEIDDVDFKIHANQAEANYELQKTAFNQAERDKERGDALFKTNVMPKEKYEKICTSYDLAKSQMKLAEEQLKLANRNLEYTKISAPVSGHITKKSVEVGNQVNVGQALLAIVSEDVWVVANFKETELTDVKPGQEVVINVDTYPGKSFKGHVDSIQRGTGAKFSLFPPENAAGNFVKVVQRIPVKIVFDEPVNGKYPLAIGMSVVPKVKIK